MVTRRGVPPGGVLLLAAIGAVCTVGFSALTVMTLGMTRDPAVPAAFAWLVVGFLALMAALLAWTTWGILRGRKIIGERLLERDESLSGFVYNAIVQRLLASDEARRWFGLGPRERA